jgi:hypothetical protein
MTDELERRLRTARPPAARVDEDAVDEELLAHLRGQPIAARTRPTVRRAIVLAVAAGVTLTATAVLMLGGAPNEVGGPSSASAVTQALHWLDPPPGTILHARSVETTGSHTTTREFWQSSDDPSSTRLQVEGEHGFESTGEALYDPATDTIYDPPGWRYDVADLAENPREGDLAKPDRDFVKPQGDDGEVERGVKRGEEEVGMPVPGKPADGAVPASADGAMPAGDPIVAKVRSLLSDGRMVVTGREVHNGTDAWAISLKADAGEAAWTLWVSAADGRPLELRDPGSDASAQPQLIRWSTYEVLPDSDADELLTLTGAHPSARVVRDVAQTAAAVQRLVQPEG